jgi:hypothetical protein
MFMSVPKSPENKGFSGVFMSTHIRANLLQLTVLLTVSNVKRRQHYARRFSRAKSDAA